jgi:ubiquinone/menaquinone biosynthesis C-methylase UbiE
VQPPPNDPKPFYSQPRNWHKLAHSYLKDCEKILDVGCGRGEFALMAPDRVTGLERREASAEFCRQRGVNVVMGEATELPFEDESFDGVHCSHVIEHLYPEQAHKLLSEADRVLKKGGLFCLSSPMLCSSFYSDFTHVRPYNPWSVLHYLGPRTDRQNTMEPINDAYDVVKIKFRRKALFAMIEQSPTAILRRAANYLFWLLKGWRTRDTYMLVLRKR